MVLIFLAVGAAGGFYYYEKVYVPAAYAKAVVPLYDEFGVQSFSLNTVPLNGPTDYRAVGELVQSKTTMLTRAHSRLASVTPPKKYKSFHNDFIRMVDAGLAAVHKTKIKVDFLAGMVELRDELTEVKATAERNTKTRTIFTVKDIRDAWLPHFSLAKAIAKDAFGGEETARVMVHTFEELYPLWQKTEKGIGTITEILNSLAPSLPVERIASAITSRQNQDAEEGLKNIEALAKAIEDELARNNAYGISTTLSEEDGFSAVEVSETSFRVYQGIEELRKILPR